MNNEVNRGRPTAGMLTKPSQRLKRMRTYLTARVNPSPIIVLGNQESGTSTIAVLLAKATRASVTLDFPCWSYREAYRGTELIQTFVDKNRIAFSRDIVKEPALHCPPRKPRAGCWAASG